MATPVPFAQLLSEKFGIPVAITNDANAAAIGEMTYGVARGIKDFIMITLGTGVGSGIVINGQLVYGHDGFAGELGHVIVKRNNGRLCGCGRAGCLETYCSATGVARTAREFLEIRTEPSTLRDIPVDAITSKDVYDAAMVGDKIAKEIFVYHQAQYSARHSLTSRHSRRPRHSCCSADSPRVASCSSSPSARLWSAICSASTRAKVKVLQSELREADAAILGASALGWEAKPIGVAITPP